MLRLRHLLIRRALTEPPKTKVFTRPEGKNTALTLTLTLNHLANKPQQTTRTLFGLMYQVRDGYL